MGIFFVFFWYYFNEHDIDQSTENIVTVLGFIFGVLCTYGLYRLLESRWSKVKNHVNTNMLDEELIQRNP